MLARADSVSGTSHYYVRVPAGAIIGCYSTPTASYVSNTWKIYWYKKNDVSTLQEQTIVFNDQYTSSSWNSTTDSYSTAGHTIEIEPDTDYIIGIADASIRRYSNSWLARFGTNSAYMSSGLAEASYVNNIRQILNIDTSATIYWEDANITYDTTYGPTGGFLQERFAYWTNLTKIVDHNNEYIDITCRAARSSANNPYVPANISSAYIMYKTFYHCSSLSYTRLPYIRLFSVTVRFFDRYCFCSTFEGCTSLTETVPLLADPTSGYYSQWVDKFFEYRMYYGCTSLTTTTDKFGYGICENSPEDSYHSNFFGTSGKQPRKYYKAMKYYGCTSLLEPEEENQTPIEIVTTTLVEPKNLDYFAYQMYYNCTSLQYAAAECSFDASQTQSNSIQVTRFRSQQYYGCTSLAYVADQFKDFPETGAASVAIDDSNSSHYRAEQFYNCNKMKFTVGGLGTTPLQLQGCWAGLVILSDRLSSSYSMYRMFYLDRSHQVDNTDTTQLHYNSVYTISDFFEGEYDGFSNSHPGYQMLTGHDNMDDYSNIPDHFV